MSYFIIVFELVIVFYLGYKLCDIGYQIKNNMEDRYDHVTIYSDHVETT